MPTMSYESGRLIRNIDAVVLFIQVTDEEWKDSYAYPGIVVPVLGVCEITCFIRDLVSSAYMDVLGAEYSRPGYSIGRGSFGGSFFLKVPTDPTSGLAPGNIRDQDLQQAILDAVNASVLPPPTDNTCYIAVTPGEVLWAQGLTGSASGGAGYHGQLSVGQGRAAAYAVIPLAGQEQGTEATISHEIAEVVTDADNDGWRDRTQAGSPEIADLCVLNTVTFHNNEVSTFWSRFQNRCIGPPDDTNARPCVVVDISGGIPYCDGGNVEGRTVTFSAHATADGQSTSLLRCYWTASPNAEIVGPVIGSKVQVKVPSPPAPFDLTASIVDGSGCLATRTRQFASVSGLQARFFQFICNVLRHLRLKYPIRVNPLWDPLRDLALQPPTTQEIKEIREYAAALNGLVEQLEKWPELQRSDREG